MTAPTVDPRPGGRGTNGSGGRGRALAGDGEVTPKPTLDQELGVRLAGMPFSESFADGTHLIHRVSEPSVRQLVDMRHNDGQARGLYRLITMPIRAAAKRATWVPSDDGGEKEAEFAEKLLTTPYVSGGMKTTLNQVIAQMLLSVFDGFAAFELVYKTPKKGPLEGKIALEKIAYRPAETVKFAVTDHGDYNGFKQRTYSPNGKYIDELIKADYSLYISMNEEENPFYGVSFFNSAFYHYDKKVKLYYLAHLAAQHRAVGSRLGKYPSSATPGEKAAFRKALADFGLAQSVTVPGDKGGWSVEDLGKSLGDFPFMDFINHHNSSMSKSVLAAFFDDAQGGQKSLVDFGGQSDSMYTMLIDVIVDEVESVVNNQLLPRFIDWNFDSGKYPKFALGAFSDEQKQAIRETFDKLATAATGANVTRPFLLELEKRMSEEMGLEIDYKKYDEALEKQEDLTLEHFMNDEAGPPPSPPFQAIGTAPADREQGVPPTGAWMPSPENGFGTLGGGQVPPGMGEPGGPPGPGLPGGPPLMPELPPGGGGMPALPDGGAPPSNKPPAPTRRRFPAMPSQLQMTTVSASDTWTGTDDLVSLSMGADALAIRLALEGARARTEVSA